MVKNMKKWSKCYQQIPKIWCAWVMIITANLCGMVNSSKQESQKKGK